MQKKGHQRVDEKRKNNRMREPIGEGREGESERGGENMKSSVNPSCLGFRLDVFELTKLFLQLIRSLV